MADSLSRLAELVESESVELDDAVEPSPADNDDTAFATEPSGAGKMVLAGLIATLGGANATGAAKSLSSVPTEVKTWLTSFPPQFRTALVTATASDALARKILASPSSFPSFAVIDLLVFHCDRGTWRLVIPSGHIPASALTSTSPPSAPPTFVELVVDLAHRTIGHLGVRKTL